jgi:hypothetical protein
VLENILTKHGGCTRDGNAVIVPDDSESSLYVSLGSEVLIIDRVRRVELDDDVAVVKTARRETYAVAYEDVRTARFSRRDNAGY